MEYQNRRWIMPVHLNGHGNLFGGQLLAWIDEEAAIYTSITLESTNIVTAHMSEINFKSSAKNNDIIEIGCDITKIGKTSITVKCVVRNIISKQEIITIDQIVFVNLDETGKPSPHKLYLQQIENL